FRQVKLPIADRLHPHVESGRFQGYPVEVTEGLAFAEVGRADDDLTTVSRGDRTGEVHRGGELLSRHRWGFSIDVHRLVQLDQRRSVQYRRDGVQRRQQVWCRRLSVDRGHDVLRRLETTVVDQHDELVACDRRTTLPRNGRGRRLCPRLTRLPTRGGDQPDRRQRSYQCTTPDGACHRSAFPAATLVWMVATVDSVFLRPTTERPNCIRSRRSGRDGHRSATRIRRRDRRRCRGATARCTAARRPSTSTASVATNRPPASTCPAPVARPSPKPTAMNCPNPPPSTNAAKAAVATTCTAAVRRPAARYGTASGISTRSNS